MLVIEFMEIRQQQQRKKKTEDTLSNFHWNIGFVIYDHLIYVNYDIILMFSKIEYIFDLIFHSIKFDNSRKPIFRNINLVYGLDANL